MTCVDSSVVRIPAFQAGGPGSIPGRRILQDVPVAKWIRRRFPEPKIVGSSPTWDGESLSTHSSSLAVEHRSYEPGVAGSIPAWSMPGACSVMVIIGASQALDPGSIPGRRSERVLGH